MTRVRLRCPRCKKQFGYSFVVGVPINSIKTWNYRYLECPGCRHWSNFKLVGKGVRKMRA